MSTWFVCLAGGIHSDTLVLGGTTTCYHGDGFVWLYEWLIFQCKLITQRHTCVRGGHRFDRQWAKEEGQGTDEECQLVVCKQSTNHIFLKKIKPGCCVKLHRTRFGQYQPSSAVLGWLGDGKCSPMHKMQSGGWPYPKRL